MVKNPPNSLPSLSIIILSYNTAAITVKCLQTIYENHLPSNHPLQVIIWDNASSDDSVAQIKKFVSNHTAKNYLSFELHASKENNGFSKGNNDALSLVKHDNVLLLNSDIEVLDNAIEKLFCYFLSTNNPYDIIGGKLFNPDMSEQASCGPYFTLPVIFVFLLLRGEYWGFSRYSPKTIKTVDWVMGACMLMKTSTFRDFPFDNDQFMYMEEVELQLRARDAGLRIGFFPNAHFIHLGSASSGSKKKPIINTFKGFKWLYVKHHSKTAQFIMLLILKFKCYLCIILGKLLKRNELTSTYVEALSIIS